MKKNYKVYDLLRFISENTGIPQVKSQRENC